MEFRNMQKEDVEDVADIEKENFSIPWSADAFLDALSNDNAKYMVAVCEGKIIGYVGAWLVMGEAEITNVCIHSKVRKKGIGKMLLESFISSCKDIDIFFLEVRESNVAAKALYNSMGFKEIGVRKNFYEKPVENAIVMSLIR